MVTDREGEIAATSGIAAEETDVYVCVCVCVSSSIYSDQNLMIVSRETCTLMTDCTTITSDIVLHCTKILLYQHIYTKVIV